MKDFKGKVAFMTGGGSGVALGQAEVFAAAGMRVVMNARRAERATESQQR